MCIGAEGKEEKKKKKESSQLFEKSSSRCLYGEKLLCMYLWKKNVLATNAAECVEIRWLCKDSDIAVTWVLFGGGVLWGVLCFLRQMNPVFSPSLHIAFYANALFPYAKRICLLWLCSVLNLGKGVKKKRKENAWSLICSYKHLRLGLCTVAHFIA